MSEYKKLDEIFPDGYGDGRKFVSDTNTDYWFVPYFKDPMGRWHASDFSNDHFVVYEHVDVREWFPPKQTKKVKMYMPVCKSKYAKGEYVAPWNVDCHSNKDFFEDGGTDVSIVGYIEIDAEVEE